MMPRAEQELLVKTSHILFCSTGSIYWNLINKLGNNKLEIFIHNARRRASIINNMPLCTGWIRYCKNKWTIENESPARLIFHSPSGFCCFLYYSYQFNLRESGSNFIDGFDVCFQVIYFICVGNEHGYKIKNKKTV